MKKKVFIKLHCKIHEDFKKWFSYNSEFKFLYSTCKLSDSEFNSLGDLVQSYGLNLYNDGIGFIIG